MASSAGTDRTAGGSRVAAGSPAGGPRRAWIGPFCAIAGVLGFSFKAILVKLAYAGAPVDGTTLLALRMLYSAPMFAALAWWAGRQPGAAPLARQDWLSLAGLGFMGYYLASLLDFIGLQYISASLERLILFVYPTMVVLLSAVFLRRPITLRAVGAIVLCYAGIAFAFLHDVNVTGDARSTTTGGLLVFAGAFAYAVYLVFAGRPIARMGSLRFVAWAMLMSTLYILVHFALTHPLRALDVSPRVHALSLTMAVFSTVIPTLLIAESIRRLGANTASLIGSLGPIFTIGLGVWLLDEPIQAIQLVGAALVLSGVALVTLCPRG